MTVTRTRREPPNHNTLTCYANYRCRLPECVARYNRRTLERLHSQEAGTWERFVDAQPVRDHVNQLLECGATVNCIATRAGVGRTTLQGLLSTRPPRKYRMEAEVARLVLAVTAADVTPPLVPAHGTVRRMQALVAEGWPIKYLAAPLGFNDKYIYLFLKRIEQGATDVVLASTARHVTAAYEELCRKRPTAAGIAKASSAAARRYASSRRWPTVAYWAERMDVIDDPDFEPLYGVTRREIVAQDANWLMRTNGLDRATAAARLGISKAYIDHAFRDHPEYALDVAA